jgi:hypothetical protein
LLVPGLEVIGDHLVHEIDVATIVACGFDIDVETGAERMCGATFLRNAQQSLSTDD